MLLSIAILLCTTVDNWPIPCSVKAKGKVGRNFKVWRWSQFATTSLTSSFVNSKRKDVGNLAMLRFACSFRRFVVTP